MAKSTERADRSGSETHQIADAGAGTAAILTTNQGIAAFVKAAAHRFYDREPTLRT